MIEEIWKDIREYESLYQVSNYSRVKRLAGSPECKVDRILKPSRDNSGYLQISLWKNNKAKYFKCHRLALEIFKGLCPPGMESRHLDGNQLNGYIDNLEWNFHIVNIQDKIKHGTMNRNMPKGSKHFKAKLNNKQIIEIRKSTLRYRELAKKFDVSSSTISNIKNKRSWKHIE